MNNRPVFMTLAGGVFAGAVLLAYGVGFVAGHGASTTGPVGVMPPALIQSPALSARTPSPPRVGQGGVGGGALSAQTPTPASTTVVQAQVSETATLTAQIAETPAFVKPAPTVIISAMTPTARATELPTLIKPSEVTPGAGIGNGGSLNKGTLEAQVRAAVVALFPASEVSTAMRIARCESGYEPWAAEPGGRHFGVFQLDPSLHGPVPADIWGQVAQAAALWTKAGWGAWSCR